jgi:hypothetical protein
MRWLGLWLIAALLALTPSYGSAQPAGEKAPPAAQSYTPKERQAYQKKVAADLDKLQQEISDLGAAGGTAAPQMKRARMRVLLGLQKQVFAAQNQLATMEKASGPEWSGLKAAMDKALSELIKSYKEAEARLQ